MTSAPTRATLLVLSILCLALVWALPAQAAVAPRSAGMESGTLREFDQLGQLGGSVTADSSKAFAGSWSARAQYDGGTSNAYQRGIWGVSLNDGDDVWYSAAFFLPVGFKAAVQGEVDLLRWDNWVSHPNDTDWGGLVIFGSDKRMRLMRFAKDATASTTLVGPFEVPEGRWVRLEVHQVLGIQNALSEVFMDGVLVGRSTQPNTYGRPIERLRAGIVAIAAGRQTNPLTLWFDNVALDGQSAGGATPPPAPAPAPEPAPAPAPEPAPAPAPAPESAPAPAPAPESAPPPVVSPAPSTKRPRRYPRRPARAQRSRAATVRDRHVSRAWRQVSRRA